MISLHRHHSWGAVHFPVFNPSTAVQLLSCVCCSGALSLFYPSVEPWTRGPCSVSVFLGSEWGPAAAPQPHGLEPVWDALGVFGHQPSVVSRSLWFFPLREMAALWPYTAQPGAAAAILPPPSIPSDFVFCPFPSSGSMNQFTAIYNGNGELINNIKYYDGFMGQRVGAISCLAFHPHWVCVPAFGVGMSCWDRGSGTETPMVKGAVPASCSSTGLQEHFPSQLCSLAQLRLLGHTPKFPKCVCSLPAWALLPCCRKSCTSGKWESCRN